MSGMVVVGGFVTNQASGRVLVVVFLFPLVVVAVVVAATGTAKMNANVRHHAAILEGRALKARLQR